MVYVCFCDFLKNLVIVLLDLCFSPECGDSPLKRQVTGDSMIKEGL